MTKRYLIQTCITDYEVPNTGEPALLHIVCDICFRAWVCSVPIPILVVVHAQKQLSHATKTNN